MDIKGISVKKLQYFNEFLTEQLNHWLLFPFALFFSAFAWRILHFSVLWIVFLWEICSFVWVRRPDTARLCALPPQEEALEALYLWAQEKTTQRGCRFADLMNF